MRSRQRRVQRQFAAVRDRFYDDMWSRAGRALGGEVEKVGYGYSVVRKGGQQTFVNPSGVMLDSQLSARIALNKPFVHQLFYSEEGYRAPRSTEYDIGSFVRAHDFLQRIRTSAVVKPADRGYAGRGVTASVRDRKTLTSASLVARAYSNALMIEEEISGDSYRLLFLGGELIHVVRRGPPTVVGDGRRSIRELIESENITRLGSTEVTAVNPLAYDLDCRLKLRSQDMTLRTVPTAGSSVATKVVVNQNAARDNTAIPPHVVDQTITRLGGEIAATLDLHLLGLDVITSDITVPLNASQGVVNEVNATPGLHHHYLVHNRSLDVDVAALILDYVFSRSKAYRTEPAGLDLV